MSEIYRVWWVCVDLSEESLQDISNWKLRNIRIAFREASKTVLWDEDIASARSRNIRDISNKASIEELVQTIKRNINKNWESKIDFARADEAREALKECTCLTTEQKSKINITAEYIEIDGIKIKLSDEPDLMDYREFKDIAPTQSQWEKIINFLWNDNDMWIRQWWWEERVKFFLNVLGIKYWEYASSTECSDSYTLETYMSGKKYRTLWFEGRDFIHVNWMKNQWQKSNVRALIK